MQSVFAHNVDMLNSRIEEVHTTATQILLTPNLTSLINNKYFTKNNHHYTLYKIYNEIRHFQLSNHLIKDYYLLLNDYNATINSQGVYDTEWFYMLYDQDYTDILSSSSKSYNYGTILDIPNSDELLYTLSFPIGNYTQIQGVLFIVIDKEMLMQQLPPASTSSEDNILYVLDTEGNILMTNQSSESTITSQLDFQQLFTEKFLRINKKKYFITSATADFTEWKFINLIPQKEIYTKLSRFSLTFLLIFINPMHILHYYP